MDPENEYFTSIDGVLFDKEVKTVIAYPGGKADTTYQVPDGVETIGRYGFYFATFENVVLPESLTTIEAYGLSYCSKLNGIGVPRQSYDHRRTGVLWMQFAWQCQHPFWNNRYRTGGILILFKPYWNNRC